MKHHACCDYWCDHYSFECTCGLTRPAAAWFADTAKVYAERLAQESKTDGNAAGLIAALHRE
jgi:hypothetical protein